MLGYVEDARAQFGAVAVDLGGIVVTNGIHRLGYRTKGLEDLGGDGGSGSEWVRPVITLNGI